MTERHAIIRLAREDDVEHVLACVRAAYARFGDELTPGDADWDELTAGRETWVADAAGAIVGVLVIKPRQRWLWLENVAVTPDWQGRGLGGRLVAFAEQCAIAAGLGEVRLYTDERMADNLTFYPHIGYGQVGRRHEHGVVRVYFAKQLDPPE